MPTTPSKARLLPRQVLGELTPNAKLSPQRFSKSPAIERTTIRQEQLHAINRTTDSNKTVSSPPLHGTKRTFAEFNDAPIVNAQQPISRHEQVRSTDWKAGPDATPQRGAFQALTDIPPTAGIVDLEASPEASQASQASFTSLIEYNPAGTPSTNAPAVSTPPASTGDTNLVDIRSQVEILRLRLRVAMFKVQTNQTHLPMSQLEIAPSTTDTCHPVNPKTRSRGASTVVPTSQPLQLLPLPDIILSPTKSSPESQPQNRPVRKLLPAPILRPTAYSTRFIHAPPPSSLEPPSLPSSPPDSDLRENPKTPSNRSAGIQTPVRSSSRKSKFAMSSPPNTVEQEEGRIKQDDESLSSSIVKGRVAARGLVELMRAA